MSSEEQPTKKLKTDSTIHLKYWDGRGLMEVPRMLLALAGKYPGDYIDGRYTTDVPSDNPKAFNMVKKELSHNLGRMPMLAVGSDNIGQSAAINYYLATEFGYMGNSTLEGAQILAISEHLKELNLAFRKVCPYGVEPSTESLDKWFDTGAEDRAPEPADSKRRSERFLKWWMGRIEDVVGSNGFAVGSKISLVDVQIYNTFKEYLKDEEAAPTVAQWKREAFASKTRTDAALAAFPKLKNICDSVGAQANIQKWLKIRGVQRF